MRIKHVLMMVGLTLVMVVLGLSVGREGSSVVEAEGTKNEHCDTYNGGACMGFGACIGADEIVFRGPCSFQCARKTATAVVPVSEVHCAPKPGASSGAGHSWGGGGGLPSAWSDCYYQAVCDNSGTNCI